MKATIKFRADGKQEYFLDGVQVTKRQFDRKCPDKEVGATRRIAAAWPMKSDAMGCHPDQIPEAREAAASAGIQVDFTPDGRAILESRQHRKQYAEFLGYRDRNGGYGDPGRY